LEQSVCGTFLRTILLKWVNLSPEFQNKGIMISLNYIIDFGFNELKLIRSRPSPIIKMRALKVIRKTGFHFMENRKDQDNIPIVFMNLNSQS
jgi:hypothetical protein